MTANIPRPSTEENVSTTISSGINDVTTTISVTDASKLVAPCYLVIDRVDSAGVLKSTSLWEYVKVTNIAGNDLTVTRGANNSTAQSHSAGAIIEAVVTSAHFEDWYAVLNPEHDNVGGHVITGTMTVAGMNLASVATIASMGAGTVRVLTHLNVSGASISGIVSSDPLSATRLAITSTASIQRLNISDSLTLVSLASGPNILRTGIGSNVVLQRSTFSSASVAQLNGVNLAAGTFATWPKAFATLYSVWGSIDKVTTGADRLLLVDTMVQSSTTQPGVRLVNVHDSTAASDVVITLYGLGAVNGGVA